MKDGGDVDWELFSPNMYNKAALLKRVEISRDVQMSILLHFALTKIFILRQCLELKIPILSPCSKAGDKVL